MKAGVAQIRGIVDAADPAKRLYLFHGPDEAAAGEYTQRLMRALGDDVERVDIEPRALRDQPGRLADEAASLSLFGGKRLIRVSGIDESAGEAVTLLLTAERAGNPVVAIGPGLKTSGKLVKLAIASSSAVAHACYLPEGQEATRLASAMAREYGLRLIGDAPQRLAAACGGDRAILLREIEKLALYLDAAPDRPCDAGGSALDAIGADLGEAEISGAVSAVIDGRPADIGAELAQLSEAGVAAIPLLRQLVKRLISLAEMRVEIDAGANIEDVMERHRVFFREKAATGRALRRWQAPQITRAIERLREAERALMRSGAAGEVLAEAECAAIARAASRFG